MLHDYIGDDAFRAGLHNYLKEYSYKNTVTVDLWSHLAKAANKPVNEVMSSWTLQMVSLKSSSSENNIYFVYRVIHWLL
jgi:aminopeptidase N